MLPFDSLQLGVHEVVGGSEVGHAAARPEANRRRPPPVFEPQLGRESPEVEQVERGHPREVGEIRRKTGRRPQRLPAEGPQLCKFFPSS